MIKKAVKKARHFIRTHVIDNSKFLTSLNESRIKRAREAAYIRHQTMTYAQIESEISKTYENIFNRKLNWDNPQAYTEKMQVAKVYMPTPEKTRLADKYLAREWIREKVGEQYLIPLYGVYDSFDEIDFDSLPDKFVIKCNHDSGSIILVNDKNKINIPELKKKYDLHMSKNFAWWYLEMHYKNIKPRIVIEKFMEEAYSNDYRFFCFDGKPYYCAIDFHDEMHHISERNFYDMDWKLQPFRVHYSAHNAEVPRPENFDEMKRIAVELCKDFGHIRIDLYSIGGKVYCGEMTFTHAGGTQRFYPDEWDFKVGALWTFDNSIRKKILSEHSSPLK